MRRARIVRAEAHARLRRVPRYKARRQAREARARHTDSWLFRSVRFGAVLRGAVGG